MTEINTLNDEAPVVDIAVAFEALDDISFADLQAKVEAEAVVRRQAAVKTIASELNAKCAALGVSVDDVFASLGKSHTKTKVVAEHKKVPAKYRHIDSEGDILEWSGRGKAPRWVTAYVDAGNDLEDILIAKA